MGSKNKHAKPVGPATGSKAPLKHKEKRKNRKVKKGQQSAPISKHANAAEARSPRPPTAGGPSSPSKKGGSVLQKMREKLQGGHFRWINEQLYTTEGTHALSFMRKNPALFDQYHQGGCWSMS